MEELLSPDQLAAWIQRPVKTLAQWRYLGKGPRFLKLEGGHVRYRRSDIEDWLNAQVWVGSDSKR